MGNGGATLKKRDLIVTLLYFLDMAVLILSVMFSIWMRNEFRVERNHPRQLLAECGRACRYICLRVHVVEDLSGALGVCLHARRVHSCGVCHELVDSFRSYPHCAEISGFCAEHIYYGGTAFGRRRGGCQNGAQNAQTQAVEGHYAQVEPQQHYDNRCRRRRKYIDPRDKNKSRYGILSGLYS